MIPSKMKSLHRGPDKQSIKGRSKGGEMRANIIVNGSIADLVHVAQVCRANRMEIRHWMAAAFSSLAAASLQYIGIPAQPDSILNLPYLDTLPEPHRKISREEFIDLLIDSAEAASCKDFKWRVKRINFEDEELIIEMGGLHWDRKTKWETLKS